MIPDGDRPVGPCRRKGVVNWMKGKRVDGPDVVDVVDGLTVAFKGVFFILYGWGGIKVFDSDAAFDGGGCVSCIPG